MKLQGYTSHQSSLNGVFAPPYRLEHEPEFDDAISELRDVWPSVVDVAKKPGTLYRLRALLNS